MDIDYLNYKSQYGYKVLVHDEEDEINLKDVVKKAAMVKGDVACFSRIRDSIDETLSYKIVLKVLIPKFKDLRYITDNQLFIFTKKETKQWVETLKAIKDFDYTLKFNSEKVEISFLGTFKRTEVLFVLSGLRFLYEYPQVDILKTALKLFNKDRTNGLGLFQTVILLHYFQTYDRTYDIHSFLTPRCIPNIIPDKEIGVKLMDSERISYVFNNGYKSLGEFLNELEVKSVKKISSITEAHCRKRRKGYIGAETMKDLKGLYNNKPFEERFNIYKERFNSILEYLMNE